MPNAVPTLGLAHFLTQSSPAELLPLYLLVAMSIATWCIILLKAAQAVQIRRKGRRFLRDCWEGGSLARIEQRLAATGSRDPWSRLVAAGLAACRQLARPPAEAPITDAPLTLGVPEEFLTRALRRALDRETLAAETGLTLLATVGSAAPFIGLFGTVWGIYHALIAIGQSGQSSLEQVAGPVGEALIMTAFGLATALPAVIAYNAFARGNRRVLADLDGFAHDLFTFLGSGRLPGGGMVRPAAPYPLQSVATERRGA